MNEEQRDTSPLVPSRRIKRHIHIEERNDPPMSLFDTTVVYASDHLPEWFAPLQPIVEDETFTKMLINLGGKTFYHITIAGGDTPAPHWHTPPTETVHVANGETSMPEQEIVASEKHLDAVAPALRGEGKMNIQEYQHLAHRTLAPTEASETIKLTLIGMQGELGEIAEPLKKHLYSGHDLDTSHIEQEIGDLLWYLANLCTTLDIDMQHAMQRTIEKLEHRYPEGFSCERSINREETHPA